MPDADVLKTPYRRPFSVTILGSGAALPAYGRHPTAQYVTFNNRAFLFDCGEGTQMLMQAYGLKTSRIGEIFISHRHGDHYFGLVGLLTSLSLIGRQHPLRIFCPQGVKAAIDCQVNADHLGFDLTIEVIDPDEKTVIYNDDTLTIETLPMRHSIPCCGFLLTEKPQPRSLIIEKIDEYGIPIDQRNAIKNGADLRREDGSIVSNALLTTPPPPPRRYAFFSDTAFQPEAAKWIQGVDLLYHETTFLQDEAEMAAKKTHATTAQAAEVAKLSNAKKLIIGHFSARHRNLKPFKTEIEALHPNAALAIEGKTFKL